MYALRKRLGKETHERESGGTSRPSFCDRGPLTHHRPAGTLRPAVVTLYYANFFDIVVYTQPYLCQSLSSPSRRIQLHSSTSTFTFPTWQKTRSPSFSLISTTVYVNPSKSNCDVVSDYFLALSEEFVSKQEIKLRLLTIEPGTNIQHMMSALIGTNRRPFCST